MPRSPVEPGIALHHHITSVLRGALLAGRYRPNDMLPSEESLMASFAVSRGTVRRALLTLQQQGWVERIHGRGTRVVDQPAGPLRQLQGQIADGARAIAGTSIRLIGVHRHDDGSVRVERLRSDQDRPLWLTTAFMPGAIARHFSDEDFAEAPFTTLFDRIGKRIGQTREEIGAICADPQTASLLGITPGTALIDYRRTLEDQGGGEICRYVNLIPPDRHRLRWTVVADDNDTRWDEMPYGEAVNRAAC